MLPSGAGLDVLVMTVTVQFEVELSRPGSKECFIASIFLLKGASAIRESGGPWPPWHVLLTCLSNRCYNLYNKCPVISQMFQFIEREKIRSSMNGPNK